MFKEISLIFWKILRPFNKAHNEFKQQFAYEIADVSFCPEKNKHIIEIKVSGKAKSDFYDAQDVASDDHFINGFSAKDVRTSVYLATCDKLSENQKFEIKQVFFCKLVKFLFQITQQSILKLTPVH